MYALRSPFLTLNLYVLKKIKGGGGYPGLT